MRSYIFFQVVFFRRRGSGSGQDLGGSTPEGSPLRLRSSLSQSPSRCTSLQPAGRKAATRSFYADVRFVNTIRSLVMAAAVSRRTTSITTGFGFIAGAAPIAGRPSRSFRCSLFLTLITVWWRAARRCAGALWSTARGRRRCRTSRILTACRPRRQCGAGRAAWTALSSRFPFSARPSPV